MLNQHQVYLKTLLLFLLVVPVYGQEQTVRIRLLEQYKPVTVSVTAKNAPIRLYTGRFDLSAIEIAVGEPIILSVADGIVIAALPSGPVHASFVQLAALGEDALEVDILEGNDLDEPRMYPGTLTFEADPEAPSLLRLINQVDLDHYVAAVLPKEYGFNDLEGSKAMAVVIRTYALRSAGKYGPDYDHTDHVGSQVYEGIADVTSLAREAVQQTRWEVLTYRGQLIEATHFASSGGHTANNEDVWQSGPLPYLRGKSDPYDDSPHEQWTSSIPRDRLLSVLSSTYGAGIEGFAPAEQGQDGRVRTIQLQFGNGRQRMVPANEFRLLVSRHFGVNALKSTMFAVRLEANSYLFDGSGYGHGVGLNQWGAHNMAEHGFGYRDILSFYYTGTSVASNRQSGLPVIQASHSEP
jgi:stage II sporulation protein D